MTLSMGTAGILMKMTAGLPCASCLFDVGEASGMVGAGVCPLKGAVLRRLAEPKSVGRPVQELSCAAFAPGYAEGDPCHELSAAEAGFRSRLC